MSFIKSLFKKSGSEDYEQILESLAADVQNRQTRLSELRLRERRFTLQVTLVTLSLWALYVSMWYGGVWPVASPHRAEGLEKAVRGVPVLVGPIIILFSRRIVQVWYTRKGDAEEKQLREVMKKQREKVEEIKKKTNYYTTRSLLEKYDAVTPAPAGRPGQALRQRQQAQQPKPQPQQPTTPQAPGGLRQMNPAQMMQTPQNGKLNSVLQISPTPQPIGPIRKQWYDKVADAILGDDASAEGPATSRYALICEKCFMHNGLVKESMWQDTQYVCPKCGHFNASPRSRSQAASRLSISPQGMSVPLPPSSRLSPSSNGAAPSVSVAPATDVSAVGMLPDARADGEGPDPDHGSSENMEVDHDSR
ncbi:hypothetical protein CONPUDRAFT_85028 [Coniophora puteana RWD-64-598 SS2]|uniref:Endoplasmic reticulum junction formation protein lunapark n=1 Tax=Coniophora puteana (strain RWD-64-598) TaxID=741705 RepID=A0A5M3MD09_CONPW|nr:uncharacterized protein CONPUDRAFT_85028 [Coniophora puteana RWD-64-598 SS2]EIW76515.1 hypothetical protein CONPUDRAFT_85028 [Coniophora puteana RWD-64-598 SS2]